MNAIKTIHDITFDTMNFVKKLVIAGVNPKIAETHAELQMEIQTKINEKQDQKQQQILDKLEDGFATKSEILILDNKVDNVKSELRINKAKWKGDIKELRGEMLNEMGKLRSEMGELHSEMGELRGEMKNLRSELLIKLGGAIVASTTVLATLIACINYF